MQGKLMIIGENITRVMTFDDAFKKYQGLINKCIKSWLHTYEYDDLYQLASMTLWRAYNYYDITKSPVSFGYYLKKSISFTLNRYHQNYNRHNISTCSLNAIANNEGTDKEVEYIDIIADPNDLAVGVIFANDIENIMKSLTFSERNCLSDNIKGYLQKEISEKYGLSQVTVSRRLASARRKLLMAI